MCDCGFYYIIVLTEMLLCVLLLNILLKFFNLVNLYVASYVLLNKIHRCRWLYLFFGLDRVDRTGLDYYNSDQWTRPIVLLCECK